MVQLESYENKEHEDYVYKLKKTIYGLKQAQKVWNEGIDIVLLCLGFQKCQLDHIIYKLKNQQSLAIFLAFYVDDLFIFNKEIKEIERE